MTPSTTIAIRKSSTPKSRTVRRAEILTALAELEKEIVHGMSELEATLENPARSK